MKIVSLKNNPELCEKAKLYCLENWNKVYNSFAQCADKSVTHDMPRTWVALGYEGEKEIIGFYQLSPHDGLTRFTDISPFISALFIDKRARGGGLSEILINHAKYEAASLGYEKIYAASDHIGYYEKHGFHEIGLDISIWGSAAKVYEAYTPSEIHFEVYNHANPIPDRIHLEHAKFKWAEPENNPAFMLHSMKSFFRGDISHKWFSIAAFKDGSLVGWVNFIQNPDNPLNWYLGDLAVKSDFRRKGIARRLLNRGLDIIRSKSSGGEYVFSYIEKSNTPSLELHKSLGFIDTGELKPFWELNFSDSDTTHVLFLDGKLTVKPAGNAEYCKEISKLYNSNIEPLHGAPISEEEWKGFLSAADSDEAHFLIYKGDFPAAWLKINGLENEKTAWISTLTVDPMFQRKSIGTFAVKFAEDYIRLRGKDAIRIMTTADNTAAKGLYKKCGYAVKENIVYETGDGVKREGVVFEKVM